MSAEELPDGQRWRWVGRDRRVSVRLSAGLWAELEHRAATLNLPFSAVLRHVLSQGLAAEASDEA
jgi:hypothetical protein